MYVPMSCVSCRMRHVSRCVRAAPRPRHRTQNNFFSCPLLHPMFWGSPKISNGQNPMIIALLPKKKSNWRANVSTRGTARSDSDSVHPSPVRNASPPSQMWTQNSLYAPEHDGMAICAAAEAAEQRHIPRPGYSVAPLQAQFRDPHGACCIVGPIHFARRPPKRSCNPHRVARPFPRLSYAVNLTKFPSLVRPTQAVWLAGTFEFSTILNFILSQGFGL